MGLAAIAQQRIFQMFILLLIGVICYKTKVIDRDTNKRLSAISLMLVCPFLIFMSYQIEFDAQLMRNLLIAFGLSGIMFVFQIGLAKILIKKKGNDNYAVEQLSVIYSNCGFMGVPLVNGLFGAEGVFYVTAFFSLFNLLIWTHGVIVMNGMGEKKQMLKNICSPCIVAVVLGVSCFALRLRLPEAIAEPMQWIADMNTPVAMLVAGSKLAETNLKEALKNVRIYYVCIVKLLIIPLICTLAMLPFGNIPLMLRMVPIVAVACPTGATGIMFAVKYQKNSVYASEIFALTTLLSILSIPAMVLFAGFLGIC